MRRPSLSFASRKSTLLLLLLAAGASFGVASCSKDDSTTNVGVSQDQAATVVTQAVVSQGGIVEQVKHATVAVSLLEARKAEGKLSDFCGQKNESEFKASDDGSSSGLAFSFNFAWSYALACVEEVPTEFTIKFNGKTSLATDKFSTQDTSSATYKLSGLGANSTTWSVNQTFDRVGSFVSKTTDIPSFNSTIKYTAADIKISKETHEIVSGSATVKISGTDLKGNAFKYEGSINFQGNKKAIFVVSGGKNFELHW